MRLRTFATGVALTLTWLSACDGGEPAAVLSSTPSPTASVTTAPSTPTASAPTTTPLTLMPAASAAIARSMGPSDFALAPDGSVLVTYFGRNINSGATAWRLYGARGRVLGEGRRAYRVEAAGDGFILYTPRGLLHVDSEGQIPVTWEEGQRREVARGDVFVDGLGVYRPSEHLIFPGRADPDGAVSLADDRGRFWALARSEKSRTVVRVARPGRPWKSLDLGPSINARKMEGRGSILLVVARERAYLSDDSGATWRLVVHGAHAYWGLPVFEVRPDRSVIGGDGRAGYMITTDLRTFRAAFGEEAADILVGGLFSRRVDGRTEISRDHQHWEPFSPGAVRRLWAG